MSDADVPPVDDGDAEAGAHDGGNAPPTSRLGAIRGFIGRHRWGSAAAALVLVAAIAASVLWYLDSRHFETTDDAFVDGRAFALAPKVGGYVTDILVTDNQHVANGDRIALIDQRDYRVALDNVRAQVSAAEANVGSSRAQIAAQRAQVQQAEAQVQSAEAARNFAAEENGRANELVQRGAGTVQRFQQTNSQLREADASLAQAKASLAASQRQVAVQEAQSKTAEAQLSQAKAQLEQAELNLSYTILSAVRSGRVVRLSGAKGQLAQAGQAIAMFVPDEFWVTANFKETQLRDMRPGQPVEMTIDAYPGRKLTGYVESVQPGSGTAFSLLPAQNATGNYVKVVQRVPVKLVFDDLPGDVTVGPGMSVVSRVKVR